MSPVPIVSRSHRRPTKRHNTVVSSRLSTALRLIAAAVVIAACLWFVRQIDLPVLGQALLRASLPWVAVAALLNFAQMLFRAWRLQALLRPVRTVGFGRLVRYGFAAAAATNLLPARAGEVLRVWLLKAREGIPATTSVAVALMEKVFDLVTLLVLVAPLPLLLPRLGQRFGWLFSLLVGTLVLLLGLALWVARRRSGSEESLLGRFVLGTRVLQGGRPLGVTLATSLAVWLTDAAEVLLILLALRIEVPAAAALLVLLTLNLAITLPSTPAQIGAFEGGAAWALVWLGVPKEAALAFALVYHVMQVVPVTLVGAPGLRLALRAGAATVEQGQSQKARQ